MQIRSLGWEDPLEEEMAPHFNTLAWKIPWTEEPSGLQSIGSQRVRHDRACTHLPNNSYISKLSSAFFFNGLQCYLKKLFIQLFMRLFHQRISSLRAQSHSGGSCTSYQVPSRCLAYNEYCLVLLIQCNSYYKGLSVKMVSVETVAEKFGIFVKNSI